MADVEKDRRNQSGKRKARDTLLEDHEEYALAKKLFGVAAENDSSDSDISDNEDFDDIEAPIPHASKAVWKDDDDEEDEEVSLPKKKSAVFLKKSTDVGESIKKREYQERLKAHFIRANNAGKVPKWATGQRKVNVLHEDDSDEEVDAALKLMTRTTGAYTQKSHLLPKGVIQTNILPEIIVGHFDSHQFTCLLFHKTKNVVITADKGGSIKLFEVDSDAKKEHFLQKIKFPKFTIGNMEFATGESVVCGSHNQEYLVNYNLVTGNVHRLCIPRSVQKQTTANFAISSDGKVLALVGYGNQVHLLSAASMEHIQSVNVSAPVASVTFLPGSSTDLWIMCTNGQINYWQCTSSSLHSFIDHGTVHGTKIAFSPDGLYLGCASDTGIVNVYDPIDAKLSKEPMPIAVNEGLVTACDSLAFNHDNQLLAVGSSVKVNQVKLFHLRSKTVFSNFPQHFEKIPKATCLGFSPHSAYFAVGCLDGRLRLYRISHFNDY